MKRLVLTSSLAVAVLAVIAAGAALAHGDNGSGKTRLNGLQEVPSISTTGKGSLRLRVRSDGIHYVLKYEGLESDATVAHIHFAQRDVNGGIIAFLCGGNGKPPCPARAGRVEGVITAANVMAAVPFQGIAAGELSEVLRALRKGHVYANVHSGTFPAGEIRGQLNGKRDHD